MALAGQLALGAVGAYFGGPIGFAIGSAVGAWLFAPDQENFNSIIDPGAQEMPRINQALRGVTMPILFGTNRVSSNMVWQNNFQVIRHETAESSGGGGKAGGSGMGGKSGGKNTSTTVSYEYKWDLLYHFGMVSQTFNLFGGWVGAQRMNDDTLIAITQGGAGSINFFKSDVERPQTASLVFEQGFFGSGAETSNITAENWDHFETTEGGAYRFPYTSYIGFKAMNLGTSAIVPQLSFEVGPGASDIEFDSAYIGHAAHSLTKSYVIGGSMVLGLDSNHYVIVGTDGGTNACAVHRVEDGTQTDFITGAELDTLATAAGLDGSSQYAFTSNVTAFVIPGTNYFILYGQDIGVGTRSNHAFVLCEIDANGLATQVGGAQFRSNDLASNISTLLASGLAARNAAEFADVEEQIVVIAFENNTGASRDFSIGSVATIAQMKDVLVEDFTGAFDGKVKDYSATVGDYFGIHQSSRSYKGFGFFLPNITYTLGEDAPPIFYTNFFFYIGKADVEAHNDTPAASDANSYINSNRVANPNGWLAAMNVGFFTGGVPVLINGPTIVNSNFIDNVTQEVIAPFDDAGENLDGTTDDNDDYDPSPFCSIVTSGEAAGAYIIVFSKSFTGSEDLSPSGSYNKGRMFLYNPVAEGTDNSKGGVFTQYGTGEGATFDSVSDVGVTEPNRYNHTADIQMLMMDQENKTVYEVMNKQSADSAIDDKIIISKFGTYSLGGGEDVLPPFIIHEILTSTVFGIGIPAANIDTTTYNLALQYCDAEDIRVSAIYMREQGALQHIELLLAVYGGYLTESGGKIKFGISDLSVDPVRTLDNHHFVVDDGKAPVTVTRGARQESYNKVKVNYLDRDLEYRQNFIEINDEVDQDLNGIRAREFPPKFVMKEKLAQKIAVRTLWSNLYAKDIYDFTLGPKDADLEPGDPITLIDSFHPDGELSSGVRARIYSWDERDPYKFHVRAIKEVAYINTSTMEINSVSAPSFNQLFGPTKAPADFSMYELPREFQGANASLYVGWNQLSPAMGARLYVSADGTSYARVADVQPYIISGILADALPNREPGWVEQGVQIYLMPDTGFSPASPVYVQTHALDDVGVEGRTLGAGNIFVDSEMLAYQGVTLIGQNHYSLDKVYRGWGGTHIHDHTSGSYWHKQAGGVFTQGFNEDRIGNLIHYKVSPFNFNGIEYDISSIDARTYTIQGTYFRPQVQTPIRTFVESLITGTASDNLGGIEAKHVHSSGTAVTLTWPDAARVKGYGTAGYGSGLYGRFATDTTSHNWRVEVLSSDEATVVRCLTVDSGWFVYSADINSTDFNGWKGSFSVRVTPFNDSGDALRNRTKKLRLFEQV